MAMHGAPALAAGFPHFPYVEPAAPKGGRIVLGALGTFDSLNPFIVKGVTPQGLREYVYESLMARSADEPFALYGLIAESVELPDDRSSVTFHLRPEARFSDGRPVTAEDVVFSHATLRDKGSPYHRSYYKKVARTEVLGAGAVRFVFDASGDREMPLIMGLMPVLPRHRFPDGSFERTTLEPPVGSGPYAVAAIDPGRSITYKRRADHWARDLPVLRGRYNFDEVRVELFRDSSSLFEAFKAGQIDFRHEDDPGRWAEGYRFAAVTEGRVVKREVAIGLPAGMAALVFNTRREPFDDVRVRKALIELLDFEWINRSLYHGLYKRTASFFERSILSTAGRPADAREQALLSRFPGVVTPDILARGLVLAPGDGTGSNRAAMKRAFDLLLAAGYRLAEGRMVRTSDGRPLAFEFLAANRAQERLMLAYARTLERLGIGVRIRQVDSAQYWSRIKSADFDMIQWTWGASLSPGNEQLNRWSSRAADTAGSLNYAGVKSPAADAMIEAMLAARGAEDFQAAVRAFDRVLLSGDYVIPLFHVARQWIAHWRHLRQPARTALAGTDTDTWWIEGEK